ncbi:unnamed protein product [Larinioides sclopetarius]|uniref:Uncharacterized protein n=1 Tax=Larinioides sclopetarius TaxID=280406 RepID=A0AAV1ZCW1_9ARAC
MVEPVRGKISLLASDPNNFIDVNFNAEAFEHKLIIGYIATSDLMNKTKTLTNPVELAVIVKKAITNLDLDIPKDAIDYIKNQGKYFTFLQTISDKMLNSEPWDQLFKDVEVFLANSKTAILDDLKSAAEKVNNQLQANLKDVAKVLQEEYSEIIKSLEMKKLPEKLRRDSRFISDLIQEIENGTTTEKLVNSILYIADNLGIFVPKHILRNIENQGKYLRFLDIISKEISVDGKMTWLPPFKFIAKYFQES